MKTVAGVVSVLSLLSTAVAQTSSLPTITTPAQLLTCENAALTFGGGSGPPYFISILPAGQISATPLEQFPQQTAAGTFPWEVNLASGTNITIEIRDGNGNANYAAPVSIIAGVSTTCVGQSVSGSETPSAGASSSSAASTPGTSSHASSAGSSPTSGAGSSSASPSSGPSSAAGSSSANPAGASASPSSSGSSGAAGLKVGASAILLGAGLAALPWM